MTITLYNTATRRKEAFDPLDPDNVRMYVCGPTVYDRAHLGNARPVLVFDVLYRLLRHEYGAEHVTYVRNFTDVDDKINARAAESGRSIGDITSETTQWFLDDMSALGALPPSIKGTDHERAMPRATAYIDQMVAMIEGLVADGFAYENDGHVLFRVRKYKEYGALSGRSVDDMIAGARVEVAPYKEDPMDFVLWKPSTDDLPGWDSPWGRGRPGWHIECSAMAYELLGDRFDIHGGGNDLQFPHHENEIAQSRCAGHGFANVWMHNEMLQVEGKKMSKSLGNFFTVRDLLDQGVPGEVIRFVMLSTHYRKPMDWTEKKRAEAEATLRKWNNPDDLPMIGTPGLLEPHEDIVAAVANDLNTPGALSVLHRLFKDGDHSTFIHSARWLGLPAGNFDVFVENSVRNLKDTFDDAIESADQGHGVETVWDIRLGSERINRLKPTIIELALRWQAIREAKDFASADELKSQLIHENIEMAVSPDGPEVHVGFPIDVLKLESML